MEGLRMAKLFVGLTENDVKIKHEGQSYTYNSKHLLEASSLVLKLLQNLLQYSLKSQGLSP